MPVPKESPEYNMNHPDRGYCIIFNHEEFKDDIMPRRKGSQFDADRLYATFTALGFSVKVHNDLDCDKIKIKINECKYIYCMYCDLFQIKYAHLCVFLMSHTYRVHMF